MIRWNPAPTPVQTQMPQRLPQSRVARPFEPMHEDASARSEQTAYPHPSPLTSFARRTLTPAEAMPATAVTPDLTAGDSGFLVRLELSAGDGRVTLIDMPWTLAATGRLSHRTATAEGPVAEARATASAGSGPMTSVELAAARQPWVPKMSAVASADEAVPSWAAHGPSPVQRPLQSAGANAAAARNAAQGTAVAWTERLVHWIEHSGRPTVFARDYRLDEAAAARLSERLRELAAERGVALGRVVVNGRTMWDGGPGNAEEALDAG